MLKNPRPLLFVGITALLIGIVWYVFWSKSWIESILLLVILAIFIYFKSLLSTHEPYLKTLLNNISDSIIVINSEGCILMVNHAVELLFGYQPTELLGKNIKILMPSPYREMHDQYLKNFSQTGVKHIIESTREVEGLRKNGEVFEAQLRVHQLGSQNKPQFMGIIRDVSEQKHIDKIKTEFISTVSHELRTPLTSIRGSLGILKSGVLGEMPEKANRMIELAYNNTERLINLVNDILDVEKIQAGKIDLKLESLNLTELVKQSIRANQPYVKSCQVSLSLECVEPDLIVYADKMRLEQVMANLISNAAKFSPENEQISIKLERHAGQIRVSVSDHGLGIPERYRHKIFQKFSQVDGSDTRQKGGSGLGLNITKAIIEHHGGHIDYTTVEGKGTCFFFELAEYHGSDDNSDSNFKSEETDGYLPKTKNQGHILVLEDEQDIANLLTLLLENAGFQVTCCNHVEEAKKLIASCHFDAATVDIRLPGQDGLSFVKEIRANESYHCLPVIIVSAEAEINKEKSPAALQIVDWIDKPIDTERLIKSLTRALSTQTSDQESCQLSILHVEDNKDLIEMVSSLLSDKVNITYAETFLSAKEQITTAEFDLIILDVGLPDGNGLNLIPLINDKKPLTPIIVFSAQSIDQDFITQVDAFLVKSKVTNDQLVETIMNLISS